MDTLSIIQGSNSMVFANWALVVLTLGLLIATIIYLYQTKRLSIHTKRMADTLVKDYELKVRPLLDFKISSRGCSGEGYNLHAEFYNAGEIPLRLKDLELIWWFKSQSETLYRIKKTLDYTIYKQQSWEKSIILNEVEFRKYQPEETKSLMGSNFYNHLSGILKVEYLDAYDRLQYRELPIQSLT
jgi:hypothetical protein